jgi:hypothetical protein
LLVAGGVKAACHQAMCCDRMHKTLGSALPV